MGEGISLGKVVQVRGCTWKVRGKEGRCGEGRGQRSLVSSGCLTGVLMPSDDGVLL